jgi:glycine betaine/proline transport system substrate-binding protein
MKLINTLKTVAAASALVAGASFGTVTTASAGDTLTSPDADWTGGVVTCRVIQHILENEMGYKVKKIVMPSGPGVAEGIRAGDLDFACESWPSYNTWKEKYVSDWGGDGSIVKFGDVGVVGTSSYFVPSYLVEGEGALAPDLKTWEDMNKYADLFKTTETGDKGRLLGCPVAAWQCEDQKRLDALGINYHPVELGSETAHWAEMKAAFARKEPFIAYAWTPHWIHAALDLVEITLPAHSDEAWPATGWAQDTTFNYGSPSVVENHPKVAQLIANSKLGNVQQAGMILAIDIDGQDMDDVVEAWMEANEDTWRAWIPE